MGKSDAKKSKRMQKLAREKEMKERVKAANSLEAPLDDFAPFKSYCRGGLEANISYYTSTNLPPDCLSECFSLLKANMQQLYENAEGWGWSDKKKMEELKHDDARYLVVRGVENGEFLAFTHLRFTIESDFEALYVYELQVAEAAQKKGLGKFLMQIMELLARKHGMKFVFLTTFKDNKRAMEFYTKTMKYIVDPSSPSIADTEDGECYSYEILSKCVDVKGVEELRAVQ